MALRCKPGDLAIVVRSRRQQNVGRLVEVVSFAGENPEFDGYVWCEGEGPSWHVRAVGSPMPVRQGPRCARVLRQTHGFARFAHSPTMPNAIPQPGSLRCQP